MKERPILFSGPMVRAILEGRKTQTRRVAPVTDLKIKDHGDGMLTWSVHFSKPPRGVFSSHSGGKFSEAQARSIIASQFCPYGAPGDRLWVREGFQQFFDDEFPTDRPRGPKGTMGCPATPERESRVFYRADGEGVHNQFGHPHWSPSIHMPRWASRILLEITEVRVQRLQDISEEDAASEGVDTSPLTHEDMNDLPKGIVRDVAWALGVGSRPSAKFAYQFLWDELNDKRGFGWDVNPWVWAITFRRVER